jgi:hypothetical protein
VARNNYGSEKRQRELAREKKKAEKLQRKLERQKASPGDPDAEGPDGAPDEAEPLGP